MSTPAPTTSTQAGTTAPITADQSVPSNTQGQDQPAAWDRLAAGFDAYVTPSGIDIGDAPLADIGLGPGQSFLDVAAGSGALAVAAARRGAEVTAIDFSPAMIERLEARVAAAGLENVRSRVMDGNHLAFEDDTFDAAGSQFGVMLFPDIGRGLREMVRVTRPGGRVLVVSMGPPSRVEFLTHFLGALQTAVPGFQGLPQDPPPLPFRLADPGRLEQALHQAGLRDLRVERAHYEVEHPSARHLWDWVVSSNPIGAKMAAGVSPEQKNAALEVLEGMLRERRQGAAPAVLRNAINIGLGTV